LDGIGELIVVHRLNNVIVAAQGVATSDFARIVGGCEHYDGHIAKAIVRFESTEDLDSVDFGHADIEQEKIGGVRFGSGRAAIAEEKVDDLLPVVKTLGRVVKASAGKIFFYKPDVPGIIIRNENDYFSGHGQVRS
jgi:hypothetical protein